MKKTFLSIAALIAISASADAQFYYRLGVGYAMPQAGQSIGADGTPYNGSYNNSSFNYSLKGASFSAGLQGYVALGYDINQHIGVQLDAQAGLSSRTFDLNISNITVNGVPSNGTISEHAKFPVNLVPSIVVHTGGDPWNIYCRMGVALPLHSTIEKQKTFTNLPNTGALTTQIETWEVRSSFSAGLAAAVGFEYKMNPSMSLWAEVSVLSMSQYIKEEELTAFNYNGQNIPISAITGGPTTISYSKNVQLDTTNGSRQPAYSQPFSNIGINIGIRQTFGSPRKKTVDEDTDKGYYRRRGSR